MRVTMHEVNFGEAILYQQGNCKLLVDCGAKYGQRARLAFDRVKNKIGESTKLLITHFDEDHYNGIIEMPDTQKFDEIYLPLYIWENSKIENTEEVFVDVIRTWTYLIAVGKKKKISAIHSLFLKLPKLVNSIYDIHCIGAGDCFLLEQKTIDVLWPRPNFKVRRRMYAEEILRYLRNNIGDTQKVEEFILLADKYVDVFLKIYRFYCSNNRDYNNQDISFETFFEEIERLNHTFYSVFSYGINIYLDDSTKKRIDSISSSNIKNMNECSVVLEVSNEIVAFGDITARIIKYMKKNKILSYDKYKVIKVQHHGTAAYWSDELPDAKVYLISNSGVANPNWAIDVRYGLNYSDRVTCTNDNSNRCGYYNYTKKCNMCNIGLGRTEILIDCATI